MDNLGTVPEAVNLWVSDISVDAAAGGQPLTADLFCHWSAAVGQGVVPAAFLRALHGQLGTAPATGWIQLAVGDAKEVASADTSLALVCS